MYWECPKCKDKVNFEEQMNEVFEDGEADFDPELGLFFHTIMCEGCDANWIVSISKMYVEENKNESN